MQKIRDNRRRSIWMIGLLFLTLIAYTALVPSRDDRVGILEQEILRLFRPLHVGITWVGDGLSQLWNHYFNLVHAAQDNELLRQDRDRLRAALSAATELAAENDRLRALLKMKPGDSPQPVAAHVIAVSPQPDVRTIVIDRGWADGVVRDHPVLSSAGLIGRVRVLGEHTATVLLISDSSSAVDIVTTRSRIRGLLTGATRGTVLQRPAELTQIEYLSHDSDIAEGDEVVTSGMDGVFPKGLPVGRIHDLQKNEFGLFEEAWVVPFADLSRLEEVVVR
jgi:rod shape-determining protein MreC